MYGVCVYPLHAQGTLDVSWTPKTTPSVFSGRSMRRELYSRRTKARLRPCDRGWRVGGRQSATAYPLSNEGQPKGSCLSTLLAPGPRGENSPEEGRNREFTHGRHAVLSGSGDGNHFAPCNQNDLRVHPARSPWSMLIARGEVFRELQEATIAFGTRASPRGCLCRVWGGGCLV